MSKVTGFVEKAYTNKGGFSSVLVNEVWYGTGKRLWKEMENKTVEFNAVQNGKYWNVDGDIREVAAPAAAAGAPVSADARQKSIVLQSSYKVAAQMVGQLVASGLVNLGAKSKAYDNAVAMMDELTKHVFGNCMDPDAFLEGEQGDPSPDEDYNPLEA